MSDGATMSAPATACDNAVSRQQLERLIVVHLAVSEHPAVSVRRVLAQAHVGDHDHLGGHGLDRPNGCLDDPVVGIGRAPELVLVIGDSKQNHGPNPAFRQLSGRSSGCLGGMIVLAGKRGDRDRRPIAFAQEHRLNQVGHIQASLAHERANSGSAPQPAHASGGKGHCQSVVPRFTPGVGRGRLVKIRPAHLRR